MKKTLFQVLLVSVFVFAIKCSSPKEETTHEHTKMAESAPMAVSEAREMIFYFTPSLKENRIHDQIANLINYLNNETGFTFTPIVPESNEQMIQDFGEGKVDLAFMNTLSFIKVKNDYGAQAKLKSVKYGKDHYKGQIIAHVGKGIDKIEDLNNKRFAFTNKNSSSGFLYPAKMLADNNVTLSKTVFGEKHDNVVEMVYRAMVDGGATYYSDPGPDGAARDARVKLIDKYPDVLERVKILAITDPIPNDPLVFGNSASEEDVQKICKALKAYVDQPEGKQILVDLYGTDSFVPCSNKEYEKMSEVIAQSLTMGSL